MQHIRHNMVVVLFIIFVLNSCGSASTPSQSKPVAHPTPSPHATTQGLTPTAPSTPTPSSQITVTPSTSLQHIFYIMMENHSASQILGNTSDAPYLNQLANTYGIASHYYGVTHPSLPNYLAAISGDFQGIWDDCAAGASVTCAPQAFASALTQSQFASASSRPHLFNGQTLVDQLELHHMTWKAYMQSLPSPGFTDGSVGLYAQKHDPFMYFANIQNNPARLQRIVPFSQFDQDIQSATLPNFIWISPDVCHDMHGDPSCSSYNGLIAQGDTFIHATVQKIMSSPSWSQGSAIVIAWDENDSGQSGCCHSPSGVNGILLGGGDVPLIVVTSQGPRHIVLSNASYNHYSLLTTIEQLWQLGCIANTCGLSSAELMTKLFQ